MEQDIIEGNRLIHIWMGKSFQTDRKDKSLFLKYHVSLDLLMPVVYRIFDVIDEHTQQFSGQAIFELGLPTPINEIWKAVVDFIRWHKTNK